MGLWKKEQKTETADKTSGESGERSDNVSKALSLYGNGRYSEALSCLRIAQRLTPEGYSKEQVLLYLAWVHEAMEHWDQAISFSLKAIGCNPHYAEGYFNLGQIYTAQEQLTKARDAFVKAVELAPEDPDYRRALSISWLRCGDAPRALFHSLKAEALAPGREPTDYENIVYLSADYMRFYRLAEQYIEKADEYGFSPLSRRLREHLDQLVANDDRPWHRWAHYPELEGRCTDETSLRSILRDDPQNEDALIDLGFLQSRRKRYLSALQCFMGVILRNPQNYRAYDYLFELYLHPFTHTVRCEKLAELARRNGHPLAQRMKEDAQRISVLKGIDAANEATWTTLEEKAFADLNPAAIRSSAADPGAIIYSVPDLISVSVSVSPSPSPSGADSFPDPAADPAADPPEAVLRLLRRETAVSYLSVAAQDQPCGPLDSRFGGPAALPEGFPYPYRLSKKKEPLHLLAQLNFAEIPTLPGFPEKGILQFYIAADDLFGADFHDPTRQDGFRVLYFDEPWERSAPLPRLSPRSVENLPVAQPLRLIFDVDEMPVTTEDCRFPLLFSRACGHVPGCSIRRLEQLNQEALDYLSEQLDEQGHRIGGYPFFTRTDPRTDPRFSQYSVLLLQIDTDEENGILWGDSGVCCFFIRPEDLAAKNFQNVLYTWDSY